MSHKSSDVIYWGDGEKVNILFTFNITEEQKEMLVTQFPMCTFHFKRTASCEEANKAEVIVTYGGNIKKSLLERATQLKWVMVAAAGIEKMDLAEIQKRNLVVTNVRGIHKTPMAESALAHILSLKRSIKAIYEVQQTKNWKRSMASTELKGSTALILGTGAIGMEIGRLLQAFGVTTIGCNRSDTQVDYMDETVQLEQLINELPKADIVISVLPSTEETKGLLTSRYFDAMKESAVFMNFGRGDLVEEELLVRVLQEKKIQHAVLDVFQVEPLPEESALWSLENCTISPHISSQSGKYIDRALEIFKRNLTKYLHEDSQLENIVDVSRGY